ncbi:MAG: nadh-ubiquinone/plastoquinone oxidoreductase chain 6 [Verrucomicrobiales bacterium]|nr:nadh-ubiquinone/plastoquinone oxidoreductase chain 6 [Verrucomicrobiales bacterium]
MPSVLFYIFAAVMLGFGLLVVVLRNPVSNALALAVSFLGLAALFVSLNAFFIGIIQILVYAGAVMVLFLFIVMLLDIKAEQRRKLNMPAVAGGVLLVVAFSIQLISVLANFEPGKRRINEVPLDLPAAAAARVASGAPAASINATLNAGSLPDVNLVGETLFTKYNFHLQVIGVLLLVATVGVIVISRREDKNAPAAES